MSTFMKRKALVGSATVLSLLAALYVPVLLAGEGHSGHEQHATETQAPESAPNKNAAQAKEKAASQQMDHGDMNHDGMDHENMMDKHGGTEAEAGSNHDH